MINYGTKEWKDKITEASEKNDSMSKAAASLGIHRVTFRKWAIKYGVYNPNQSGKGITKKWKNGKIPLQEILEGKHPYYKTIHLKTRLFEEGIKENKCEECGINEWNGKPINCQLDHIDGDSYNHLLENLRIVCPNCHSQTPTFCGRNRK